MKNQNAFIQILVVEDSPTQAQLLANQLEKNGFQIQIAVNGKVALEILDKSIPAMIISDVMMPEMDGYELCKVVKSDERLKNIPFVLLSKLSEPEEIIKGLDCGADNFVTKTNDFDYLFTRIRSILANIELRKALPMNTDNGILYEGKKQSVTASKTQILDMLLSSYETAISKSRELELANKAIEKIESELKEAKDRIKIITGLVPICAKCRKVRSDIGFWLYLEEYISIHSDVVYSRSYCPECSEIITRNA